MRHTRRVTSRTWSPPAALVGTAWALAAVGALFAVLSDDRAGSLLVGLAAVCLAGLALFGTLARPRLAVDADGLAVRGLAGARHWAWPAVTVRLARTRRLGRTVSTLELDCREDGAEHLVVLSRLDLGVDPEEVVAVLRALRP